MATYHITATSAKKNATATEQINKRVPVTGDFADQVAAQVAADAYAKDLNAEDYQGTWDWVGVATPA